MPVGDKCQYIVTIGVYTDHIMNVDQKRIVWFRYDRDALHVTMIVDSVGEAINFRQMQIHLSSFCDNYMGKKERRIFQVTAA